MIFNKMDNMEVNKDIYIKIFLRIIKKKDLNKIKITIFIIV